MKKLILLFLLLSLFVGSVDAQTIIQRRPWSEDYEISNQVLFYKLPFSENYSMVVLPTTCTVGQVVAVDASGYWVCATVGGGGDVTGPAGGVADGDVVGFDGETGKIIKKITSIGSASVDLGVSVASGHAVTMDANGVLQTAFTELLPDAADGAALGSATYEWSDLYLADGGVIYGQNDQSATLTSSAGAWTASGLRVSEVDGHTDATNLTAAQVSGTTIYNTGQAGSGVTLNLPAAAAGYNALFTVGTAQAFYWRVRAAATDKIYLIAADGTVAAGSDNGYVGMVNAVIGQAFACWTFKTDAYDWQCKAIAIGTSTFVATAP